MRTLPIRNLSTRADDDGTLTLEGLAVPYGVDLDYGGLVERFAVDAFDAATVPGTPLLWSHQRDEPVGHITDARNSPEGLHIQARVFPTMRGRDAITLLKSGSLSGLSVGFEPLGWTEGEYARAKLHELSLTPLPAYDDARVTATRHKEDQMPEPTTPEVVDLGPITTRLDQIEARMSAPPPAPPVRVSVREALRLQLADAQLNGGKMRAIADVIGTGNAGVLPPSWTSEILSYVNSTRYLIPRLGKVGFPTTGYVLTVPRVAQQTLVGPRGAEKSEIPSRALTTSSTNYTAAWYAGGVDIAYELIMQSDPAIFGLVVDSLQAQYATVTDKAVTLALETAASPTGAVLDFTSYKTFVTAIHAASEAIRTLTGRPGDRLSLTPSSWSKLIGLVDADGRRILASQGSTNADGAVSLVDQSVNVGGIECFFNGNAVEDMQFNEISARVSEKPPVQISTDNVALMGRDVGILGAVIPLPLYPTAIKVFSVTELAAASAKK